MTDLSRTDETKARPQRMLIGGIVGSLVGLLAAYFYTRAAEDDVRQNGKQRNPVSTGEIIGLGLAMLALLRQVSEMGRSESKKK